MKKKVLMLLLVAVLAIGITKNVYAEEEPYYTTPNGIELTQKEYTFLTTFFADGYVDIMTQAQYNKFVEEDLFNREMTIKTYTEPALPLLGSSMSPRSDTHVTPGKTLQIGKVCLPSYCVMSLINTWTVDPSVRSWDVIGAYMYNVTYLGHNFTFVGSNNGSTYFYNLKTASNGVGNSVDLPDNDTGLIINISFNVSKGGTVYGSYQHAMTNTTLQVSQKYNFDLGGEGGVFDFYDTAVGVYDGMSGVDIDV